MNNLFQSSKADCLQGALNVSRRGFLVTTSTLGAGLALGMTTRPAASSSMPLDEVNAWVHIATDDTVTIRIARSEMGQGTLTGLAQPPPLQLAVGSSKTFSAFQRVVFPVLE